jgi:hypothetical protein
MRLFLIGLVEGVSPWRVSALVFGFSLEGVSPWRVSALVFGFSSALLTAYTFDGNGDTKQKAERTRIAPPAASR